MVQVIVPTLAEIQLVEPNLPVPLLPHVTVPVGVIGVPGDVSVTVAEHVVG